MKVKKTVQSDPLEKVAQQRSSTSCFIWLECLGADTKSDKYNINKNSFIDRITWLGSDYIFVKYHYLALNAVM